MTNIKHYPTLFATKINYILDLQGSVPPMRQGRVEIIKQITNESHTNIRNWFSTELLPQSKKRLSIADSLGVSYDYLFNDTTPIENVSKPEIHLDKNVYLIPFIEERMVFSIKRQQIFPVHKRFPFMLDNFSKLVNLCGKNIYVTILSSVGFEPYIPKNANIIYSEKNLLETFDFVLQPNKLNSNSLIIKKVIKENDTFYYEILNDKNEIIKEIPNRLDDMVSIIASYTSLLHQEEKQP